MRTQFTTRGVSSLVRKFQQQPQLLHRSTRSLVAQEGRALCVAYASATHPGPGFSPAKNAKFAERIETDIRSIYAVPAKPGQIYAMMKVHAPELANAYWHAYKAQRPRAMEEIRRKANLPGGFNPAQHRQARTGPKGSVARPEAPLTVSSGPSVAAYVRKKKALVGFAKAGWAAAAKAIGGRVRRNVRDAAGNRRTEEKIPAPLRKLANRFPDSGGARWSENGSKVTLEIFTRVSYAEDATEPRLFEAANSYAANSFANALGESLRALNRRLFGRNAA